MQLLKTTKKVNDNKMASFPCKIDLFIVTPFVSKNLL